MCLKGSHCNRPDEWCVCDGRICWVKWLSIYGANAFKMDCGMRCRELAHTKKNNHVQCIHVQQTHPIPYIQCSYAQFFMIEWQKWNTTKASQNNNNKKTMPMSQSNKGRICFFFWCNIRIKTSISKIRENKMTKQRSLFAQITCRTMHLALVCPFIWFEQ